MRAGAGFNATAVAAAVTAPPMGSGGGASSSAWHSPVPYLFGGLAAMLGLIAFALLILACSYWKLSGYLERGSDSGAGDEESGDGKPAGDAGKRPPACCEERIVVIMAGDKKPTFLATPISSRASSFGDRSGDGGSGEEGDEKKAGDSTETINDIQNETQTQAQNQTQNQNLEQ